METLVQEAIDFSVEHQDVYAGPGPDNDNGEPVVDNAEDSLSDVNASEDEDQELDLNLYEQFRQCGLKMQELLLNGEEISDDLYVKVFVTKLRIQYPYKDPKTK